MSNYKNRTDTYQIPSIGAGDFISESDEERAAQIIEQQLIGAISAHSGGHGVFRTGNFVTSGDSSGFIVSLNPEGGTPAVDGFIRLVHFRVDETVGWVLFGDGVHKLYVQMIESDEGSTRQYGDISVKSTTDDDIPDDGLLIAEATVSGNTIVVNSEPDNLLKISTIDQHLETNTNPHTTLLTQDQMVISGLTVEQINTKTLEVIGELRLSGLAIFQNIDVEQDLTVGGNLVVSGNAIFNDGGIFEGISLFDQIVASDVDITSGLDLRNRVRFFEDVEVDSGITIDGRDLGQDGLVLDDHISGLSAFSNPHRVTAAQVSGIPITGSENGGPSLSGDLGFLSGVSIDGIDPTTLVPLIDGSNADSLHTHDMSGIPDQFIALSPEYGNSVLSGFGSVTLSANYVEPFDKTLYVFNAADPGQQRFSIVARVGVPADFRKWPSSGISLVSAVELPSELENFVSLTVKDNIGMSFELPGSQQIRNSLPPSETIMSTDSLNLGVFDPGDIFTVIIEASSLSGMGVLAGAVVGDLKLTYNTIFGGA